MMIQTYRAGDRVRFQPYTPEAAEADYATGTVLGPTSDIPLLGTWVDIVFPGGVTRRGVSTARLELVRRAPKDAFDERYIEDPEVVDRERRWPD